MKNPYNDVMSAVDDFILPMGSKHCNTDERNVWNAMGTMLKSKRHLQIYHLPGNFKF